MIKAEPISFAPKGPRHSPYERASREWDNRLGTMAAQAANWRRATFGALGLCGISLVGVIFLGAQPKAVPHIVEVDRSGAVVYRGRVGSAWEAPNTAVIRYHLREFITKIRSVSFDPAVIKQSWTEAYSFLTPSAANTLATYSKESDPFKRAQTERVTVDVVSILPLSGDSWQADWRETSWDPSGQQIAQHLWRGTFRLAFERPTDDEAMTRNPLGLFIRDFGITRLGD